MHEMLKLSHVPNMCGKSLIILILIFPLIAFAQRPPTKEDKNSLYGTRFRGVNCSSYEKFIAEFTFCYVKAYSRKVTTLNFGINFKKPLKHVFVQLFAYYRYGNIYREIVSSQKINWCEIMEGAGYNLFFKMMIDVIAQSIPGLFHKCPYEGDNSYMVR